MRSPASPLIYAQAQQTTAHRYTLCPTNSKHSHKQSVNTFSKGQLRWFDAGVSDGRGLDVDRDCGQEVDGCFPVWVEWLFPVFIIVLLRRVRRVIVVQMVSGSGSSRAERDEFGWLPGSFLAAAPDSSLEAAV